jgi:hypothetical protein
MPLYFGENEMVIDKENYFDIAEAIHCYLSLNHDGQWSDKYAALCASKFIPGPLWNETRCIDENYYFSEINDGNWNKINNDLNIFMGTL